jgi:hypothetical protein
MWLWFLTTEGALFACPIWGQAHLFPNITLEFKLQLFINSDIDIFGGTMQSGGHDPTQCAVPVN